jgi:hypothetical protein
MNRWMILGIAALVMLFGASLWLVTPVTAPRSTFKLTGAEGLLFKATITADDVEMTFTNKLPFEIQVAGRAIECSFQKLQPEGTITLDVTTSDGMKGSAGTSTPQGGVRAQVYKKLMLSKFMTTTF